MNCIDLFLNVKPNRHSWDNTSWSWCIILFIYYLIINIVNVFVSMFIELQGFSLGLGLFLDNGNNAGLKIWLVNIFSDLFSTKFTKKLVLYLLEISDRLQQWRYLSLWGVHCESYDIHKHIHTIIKFFYCSFYRLWLFECFTCPFQIIVSWHKCIGS